MAGFSADEKSQLISRVDSITKFFENNVSDFMKTFILGGPEAQRYTKRIADYVVYINNIFSLAFIFAHGCLRCDNDSDDLLYLYGLYSIWYYKSSQFLEIFHL